MKFKNHIILVISTLVLITLFRTLIYIFDPFYDKKISEANKVIEKIENYKTTHGEYPNSLENIGIPETDQGPFFYTNYGDKYIIYFSVMGVGESMIYYSDIKEWGRGG